MAQSQCDTDGSIGEPAADALVSLADAAKLLPKRDGKHPCIATLRRWIAKGCGGTRLRAKRVGGYYYTTAAWLAQFIDGTTATGIAPAPQPRPVIAIRTPRQAEAVRRQLTAMGLKHAMDKTRPRPPAP